MRFILSSNVLEHPSFFNFLHDELLRHPDTSVLVTGDLLNVFPEPGENLQASIFFELYGDIIIEGLEELVLTHFKDVSSSILIPKLIELFTPLGAQFNAAHQCAFKRYCHFFSELRRVMPCSETQSRFIFIPGNMDYPTVSQRVLSNMPSVLQLDQGVLDVNGIKLGGLGGIPNTAHPFKGITEISPYEMHEQEYNRRLWHLNGVDVLLTHLSPEEHKELDVFLKESSLQLLICRAPFNFSRKNDYRGKLDVQERHGKQVIYVRPFDFPTNDYYLLNLQSNVPQKIELHAWRYEEH